MITKEMVVKETEEITSVTCDLCAKSTLIGEEHADFAHFSYGTLRFHGGYGSSHDGTLVELQLCEECVFELVNRRKSGNVQEHMFWGS
jgi:hypothetical protein